eukprot:403372529
MFQHKESQQKDNFADQKLAPYMESKSFQMTRLGGNSKIVVIKKKNQSSSLNSMNQTTTNSNNNSLSFQGITGGGSLTQLKQPLFMNSLQNQSQTPIANMYQSHSQQRSVMEEYQNSLLNSQNNGSNSKDQSLQNSQQLKSQSIQNSRSITPMKPGSQLKLGPSPNLIKWGPSNQSSIIDQSGVSNINTHQMINISNQQQTTVQNSSHQQIIHHDFNKTINFGQSMPKHVVFNIAHQQEMQQIAAQSQKQPPYQTNSSLERIEEARQLNSKRQFQIKKSKSRSKDKAMKSPSDFTNVGGKSVVSLFSHQSGKTNHSAPLGDSNNFGDSPNYQSKFGKGRNLGNEKKKIQQVKLKKKIRPSSSLSPGKNNSIIKSKDKLSMTGFNFTLNNSTQNDLKERSNSKDALKKVIPIKQIKFQQKKNLQQTSQSALPKPPLHKKNFMGDHNEQSSFGQGSTAEALLKMADDRLASIELELNSSKNGSTINLLKQNSQSADSKIKKILLNSGQKKSEIQTNFNLSFNNSFNTSYNNNHQNGVQQPSLAFSSSSSQPQMNKPKINNLTVSMNQDKESKPDYQGFFTSDAIYLEKQLTNRLKEASDNEGKKMQAFTQTFNEIIKRDKNFGSLLLKIKSAYDEYIKKSQESQQTSPTSKPSYDELINQKAAMEIELKQQKSKNEELQKNIQTIKDEMEEKKNAIENLIQENERLSGNYGSFKGVNLVNVNKSASISDTFKSLQLSNSNRTGAASQIHNSNKLSTSNLQAHSQMPTKHGSRKQLLADLNALLQQNLELNQVCQQLHQDVNYFRLREKKVMYLVYILQNRGYPVNQVFEQEVKSIQTLRFQEFLDNNPDLEEQMHAELDDDTKNMFSFRSDDSYDILVDGPPLLKRRPTIVPPLSFDGFPEYESSSDEEQPIDQQQQQQPVPNNMSNPQYYQESMKYIENFYNKYATQNTNHNQNLSQSSNNNLMMKQSYQFSDSVAGGGKFDHFSSTQQVSYQDSLSRDEDADEDIKEQIQIVNN